MSWQLRNPTATFRTNLNSPGMSSSARHSSSIALLVAGAFFMENLDGTVIATALPQMAQSFHVGPVSLNVGMTAYMLTLAVFIPISGWVADRFGARTVFGGAIAVFTISSIFCGLSNSLAEFVVARIVQGIGGAMMVPVGRLVVLRSTEKQHLLRATSFITWPGLVAPVLGPPDWWIHYDLCVVALDLFSQCAARIDRHCAFHSLDRK